MKVNSLSKEIENLEKKDFSIKEKKTTPKDTPAKVLKQGDSNKTTSSTKNTTASSVNLPVVRKVAIAKRRARFILLIALFISCFSLSVFIGFIGPFLLFK